MAGILASSASRQMTSGETAANGSVSGFITGERITLSTTPTGTTYSWGESIPRESGAARSALDDDDVASPTFVPDAGGMYVITCVVDSTTAYSLVISVTSAAVTTPVESLRIQEIADSAVVNPEANAAATYVSSAIHDLAVKYGDGQIHPLRPGIIGAALTDADETLVIGGGVHRCVLASTLTANRTKTLGTTSAATGDVIEITRLDSGAFTIDWVNGGIGGGTLKTSASGQLDHIVFRFDGTDWALHEYRKLV